MAKLKKHQDHRANVLAKITKAAQKIHKEHPEKSWQHCMKLASRMRYS